MSTVLWANLLVGGEVRSEQADRYALYRHGEKLDAIARQLGLTPFLEICDTTDARYNAEEFELPQGVESTDVIMAQQGAWLDTAEAVRMLEALLDHIRANKLRFGLLQNQHDDVVTELAEVVAFARAGIGTAEKFNFSVVI